MFFDYLVSREAFSPLPHSLFLGMTQRVALAEKFFLDPVLLESMVDILQPKQMLKALRSCRLPYPECWFEFSTPNDSKMKNIGFLATQIDDETFKVHIFFRYRAGAPTVTYVGEHFIISPAAVTFQHLDRPGGQTDTQAADWVYGLPLEARKALVLKASEQEQLYKAGIIFLSILALLNTPNACQSQSVDRSRINHARERAGKPPFSIYRVLKIDTTRAALRQSDGGLLHHKGKVRKHKVRGHFKPLRGVDTWWKPFERGDASKGYVFKDYHVTRSDPIKP